MVKRLFKKSIACLMAVLMIATSLPLTALADSTTDNVVVEKTVTVDNVRTGLINQGTRYKDTYYQIVNDSGDASFSIGYWTYNTSDFSSAASEFTAAPFEISFESSVFPDSPDTNIGLSVYYATNNAADNYTGASTNVSSGIFTGSNHISNAVSYYGLTKVADISRSEISNGGTATVDVKDAVNYAVSQKLTYLTLMVMCSSASASGSPWSDIYVTKTTPSITATYNEEIEVIPGVAGIDAQISAYETKMKNVGKESLIYTNMLPAYQAYLKAVRYRDAFAYGGHDAPTEAELNAASEDLATKTAQMTQWTDNVTGKFTSAQPQFTNPSGTGKVNNTSDYTYYNNIIYTEDCKSTHTGYTWGSGSGLSGMAIEFDAAADTYVQVYYPNTVLLYDGSSDVIMPVMFMAIKNVNKTRCVWQVYPAQQTASSTYTTTKAGVDPEFQSRSTFTNNSGDTWYGKDGTNVLDFNASRNSGSYHVGADPNNTWSASSQNLGRSVWGQNYWNAYAASFQVNNKNINFSNEGFKEIGKYWVWYGGSSETYSSAIDGSMRGFKSNNDSATTDHPKKYIYVVNYKGVVDAITNRTMQTYLADVSNYKQGGLTDLITAFDNATTNVTYDYIAGITPSTIKEKGNEMKAYMKAINNATKPTADTGATSYAQLKTAITNAKKIYTAGNADYANYTQEVWDPFQTAYENAINYFYNLYTNDLVMDDAEQYIEPLNLAKENLKNGMIRSVVDTATLEIAIENAEAIVHNSVYFTASTIDAATLATLISEIKTTIWGSEENYGYDTEKIDLSDENQAKVDAYVATLCTSIEKATINFDYVTTSGYSLTTALEKAATFNTSDANEKYGNYATLTDAVNSANTYKSSIETFNGRVDGSVENAVSNYVNMVKSVVDAFTNLQAAFKSIPNGQIANKGTLNKTEFASSARSDQYKFYWEYTTGVILFKTKEDKIEYYLPTSRWGSYNKQTGTDFETCFDSIILDASKVQSGELTSTSTGGLGWPSNNGIGSNIMENYTAQLGLSGSGMQMAIDSILVTKSTGKSYGIDSQGNQITEGTHDFVTELGVTDGHAGQPYGGIYAKNGWTEFDTKTKFTIPADAMQLSATTLPSTYSKQLDLASNNAYFGVVYFWKYAPTVFVTWAGYGFERAKYNFDFSVVNVVPLFNLISECTASDFLATSSQYTTSSWSTFLNAISEANGNMNYSSMTYKDIVTECDTRYTNLWNARKNLKKAANNTKLKEALAAAKSVYENDQAKVKASSWTAFQTAYETALAKMQGDYSDLKITDVASSDQSKVDAFATALTDAQNALIYQIDFSPLKTAAETLVNAITQNKYTKASVEELRDKLNALTYLNMTTVEQAKHYTDETDVVAAVAAEKTAIEGYASLLKETDVDTSALESLKADAKAKKADPDAYDQDAITTALATISETTTVNVRGVNITTKTYADQTECDSAIATALSGIQLNTYTVTIVPNGDTSQSYVKGTYTYGTEISVSLTDKPTVDWYYEMTSPSASVAKKLYSTTDELTFIVKGDTTLTTKNATSSTQYKISYINGVNSSNVATDYVAAGETIKLDSSIAPNLPYYTFDSFSVNGQTKNSGDTITINANTNITLVYNFSGAQTYTVYVCDMSYGYGNTGLDFKVESLQYNDEVVFKRGTTSDEGYNGLTMHYTVNRGTTSTDYSIDQAGRGIDDYSNPEVYAWVQVCADDLADWYSHSTSSDAGFSDGGYIYGTAADGSDRDWNPTAVGITKGKVVAYGTDYSFRIHEDTLLIPLDEVTYKKGVEMGVIEDTGDDNGARVDTKSSLVIAQGTKASIISQFTLPTGCELVEKGILIKVNKNGAVEGDGSDLKLANAGKNGVNRLKSNYTTNGNQYVISINTASVSGKAVSEVGFQWVAYFTYKDADGNLVTVYSDVTTPTNTTDTF